MTVFVKADVEPFEDPDEFEREVTADALQHFSVIRLHAVGPRGKVTVDIARKPAPERGATRSGVLASAVSDGGDPVDVLEPVASAVERRVGLRKRLTGTATEHAAIPALLDARLNPVEPKGRQSSKVVVATVLVAITPLVIGYVDRPQRLAELAPSLFGAVFGVLVWGLVRWLRPLVEVQPEARWQRVSKLVWHGVLAAIVAALIGAAVNQVLGLGA